MKSKKLLFTTLLLLGATATYITMSSSSGGVMGSSTSGCSCHGSANSATTMTITGIPASGFVAGTPYNLTLTVLNGTKTGAGFDMTVTSGTMSNAPANTMLMGGTELHHTATKDASTGSTSWNFTWTAPATGNTVTFNVAGNAVNKNLGDSGDQWALASITFNKAIPASLSTVNDEHFSVYPNPASDYIRFKSAIDSKNISFSIVGLSGNSIQAIGERSNPNEFIISTKDLAIGHYLLVAVLDGKKYTQVFTKN